MSDTEERTRHFHLQLLNSTTAAVLSIDCAGLITFANRAAAAALGFPRPDAIVGSHIGGFASVDEKFYASPSSAQLDDLAFGGKPVSLRCADGSSLAAMVSRTPLFEGKAHVGIVLTFTPSSTAHEPPSLASRQNDSKQSQNASAGNPDPAFERHKLESVFEKSPAAMALWRGPKHIFDMVNPAYQSIFGTRQLLGKPILDALPELRGQPFANLLTSVLETGIPFVGDEVPAVLAHEAGAKPELRYYDFTYTRITDCDGNPYGVYDHAIDVTDRVNARKALEESERKLALALDTSRIGFFDWDMVDNRMQFSDTMRADWGLEEAGDLTLEEAMGKIHPADRAETTTLIDNAIANRTPYLTEYRVLRPDGSTIWIQARGKVYTDENDKPVRFIGTSVDITSSKSAAEELRTAKELAESANATKTQFLANMSHEIRTPLSAILGFTDLLREQDLDAEERAQFLDTIARNGKALTKIIDDILDLAKVESGKLAIEETEFSLQQLIDDVLELFSEKAASKGIYLRLESAPGTPGRICSDPTRIRQILINIVGNAVKFTGKGGVTIRVHPPTLDGRRVGMRISVTDTGMGISSEKRAKLFRPFVQADNSTTRQYGGTGLGLALSRRLATALGGDISIDAYEPGQGSTFVITFMARSPTEPSVSIEPGKASVRQEQRSREPDGTARPLEGVIVLVADDAPENRLLVTLLLTRQGAIVETADNGADALHWAMRNRCDLILMDLQMPVMDGYEATRSLREAGFENPIVALTAHAMAEERTRTQEAGCNEHLTKPLDPTLLIETVGRLAKGDSSPSLVQEAGD